MNNLKRTEAFLEAWNQKDVNTIVGTVSEDIAYHNIPMEPVNGRAAFEQAISPFIGMANEIVWETLFIAESESGEVLTERVDHFHLKSGETVSMRVMGIFEWSTTGELLKWRDYFDLAEFRDQMPG